MDLYQYDNFPVTEISSRIEASYSEKMAIKKAIEEISTKGTDHSISFGKFNELITGINDVWKYSSKKEKNELLNQIIDHILVTNESTEIQWIR